MIRSNFKIRIHCLIENNPLYGICVPLPFECKLCWVKTTVYYGLYMSTVVDEDDEGDRVTVCSDEELVAMMSYVRELGGGSLRSYRMFLCQVVCLLTKMKVKCLLSLLYYSANGDTNIMSEHCLYAYSLKVSEVNDVMYMYMILQVNTLGIPPSLNGLCVYNTSFLSLLSSQLLPNPHHFVPSYYTPMQFRMAGRRKARIRSIAIEFAPLLFVLEGTENC